MVVVADILALFCAFAGWYYMFYSKAADRLSGVEPQPQNLLRVRLRRICGAAMFLLGVGFYVGTNALNDRQSPRTFIAIWLTVLVLLTIIMILVWADLRLTRKLRKERKNQ